ncbi:MAG: GNAT family N-acetyltransferase [Bdellovibrionota bacterium]
MIISSLDHEDLYWINDIYAGIKFKLSNENDFHVSATIDGKLAGIGRLVNVDGKNGELGGIYVLPEFRGKKVAKEIVRRLLSESNFPVLWCIPFEPLEKFYRKFGFRNVMNETIPSAIQEKLDWCEGRYPDKAILLVQ